MAHFVAARSHVSRCGSEHESGDGVMTAPPCLFNDIACAEINYRQVTSTAGGGGIPDAKEPPR
jgi:hypothetical protein